jgi:hypothetical protein
MRVNTCDLDDVKVTGDFHTDDIRASFDALLGKTVGGVSAVMSPDSPVAGSNNHREEVEE